jgi:hypothetical protein
LNEQHGNSYGNFCGLCDEDDFFNTLLMPDYGPFGVDELVNQQNGDLLSCRMVVIQGKVVGELCILCP